MPDGDYGGGPEPRDDPGHLDPADGDSTDRETTDSDKNELDPTDAGRERLRRALIRPSRAQVVVAVLLAALGFAVVTQVRATGGDDSYDGKREQDLIDLLSGLNGASERTQRDISDLEKTRQQLRSDTLKRQAAISEARDQAQTLNILAGRVPVTGPGIEVVMQGGDEPIGVDVLLDTIEELRTAGAEAIEFNDDVRVIAQTSFEASGTGVAIDGQDLAEPFTIDVIGEPRELEGAMTFPEGPVDDVSSSGGTVTIKTSDQLEIDAVVEPRSDDYAEPD